MNSVIRSAPESLFTALCFRYMLFTTDSVWLMTTACFSGTLNCSISLFFVSSFTILLESTSPLGLLAETKEAGLRDVNPMQATGFPMILFLIASVHPIILRLLITLYVPPETFCTAIIPSRVQ